MEVVVLVKAITEILAPALPYLVKGGEKTLETLGGKLGEKGWQLAKTVWERVRGKIETKPAAKEAVQDLAKTPEDPDTQAAFRQQLKKLLTEDEVLAGDLGRLVEEAKASGVTIMALGERSVAAQEITGSTIITGEQNVEKSLPEG